MFREVEGIKPAKYMQAKEGERSLEVRWIGDVMKEDEVLGVARQSNRKADE
jgi:hypothetical protein